MPTLRPAQTEDAFVLGPQLRRADTAECEAAWGLPPTFPLWLSIRDSKLAMTILDDDGTLIGVFGVGSFQGSERVGFVWLVGTETLTTKYARRFLRECRKGVHLLHEVIPCLTNLVHEDNHIHRRWLNFMGFKRLGTVQLNGHTFIEFARMQEPCA
jgi:hypothetical protein